MILSLFGTKIFLSHKLISSTETEYQTGNLLLVDHASRVPYKKILKDLILYLLCDFFTIEIFIGGCEACSSLGMRPSEPVMFVHPVGGSGQFLCPQSLQLS